MNISGNKPLLFVHIIFSLLLPSFVNIFKELGKGKKKSCSDLTSLFELNVQSGHCNPLLHQRGEQCLCDQVN
jgi:hypothetical protein